jgi:hypothetical protein
LRDRPPLRRHQIPQAIHQHGVDPGRVSLRQPQPLRVFVHHEQVSIAIIAFINRTSLLFD